MSFIKIKTNAIEAGLLLSCVAGTAGGRGQNLVKDEWLTRFLETWRELDGERDDVVRIDDKSEEARKTREFEMDTIEQGVLAEAFLAAVRSQETTAARFRMYRRCAGMIQVSRWFKEQTTERLSPFAGKADDPAPTAYGDPAPETALQGSEKA